MWFELKEKKKCFWIKTFLPDIIFSGKANRLQIPIK